MKADIVIVNWNSGHQLHDCIQSVREFNSGLVEKCIVVDNGSSDGSADFLLGASDVDLVVAGENLGFSRACNLGSSRGSAESILFLNPDAMLLENSLSVALARLDAPGDASIGIVGVQLVGDDSAVQRSCARFPTPIMMLAKSVGLSTLVKSTDYHMKVWDHEQTMFVDHVIGAFFLVRRHVFDKLRGFEERYFVYLEDMDFSYRASKLGYKSMYISDARAYHKGGGVSEKVKVHRLYYSLQSRIIYSFKQYSGPSALLVAASTLLVEPVSRLVLLLAERRWSEIPDLFRSYRMLWAWAAASMMRSETRSTDKGDQTHGGSSDGVDR